MIMKIIGILQFVVAAQKAKHIIPGRFGGSYIISLAAVVAIKMTMNKIINKKVLQTMTFAIKCAKLKNN